MTTYLFEHQNINATSAKTIQAIAIIMGYLLVTHHQGCMQKWTLSLVGFSLS